MAYMENVAVAPARANAAPSQDNASFLFEMIVTDMHWTAMQVGTFCLMAQCCAKPDARWTLRACRHILADDTRVMRLALRYGPEVGLPPATQSRLDALYVELSDLQNRTAPLAETEAPSAMQRDLLQRLLPQWRKAALATADALSLVEPLARARLSADYAADAATIRDFLRRAGAGDLADVDRFGVVHAPKLKQRRQSPRVSVKKTCRIVAARGEFAADIVDVSREGLGLVCSGAIDSHEKLTVLLSDGRRLEGTVARSQNGQIGLLLTRKLGFNDPLFSGS